MSYIQANNIMMEFGNGSGRVAAVKGIDLSVKQGEFISVMGESGAGKSTFLSILGGLLSPTDGEILFEGINIYSLKKDKLADFRREFMGFIFQSFQLVTYLNVMENVLLPLAVTHYDEKEKQSLAMSALERVGLQDKSRRLPDQLSGGEQERVAIARAVVNAPPILFADEPTGNLDSRNSSDIMALLTKLNKEGQTVIMVTHSRTNAEYGHRIIEIADGIIKK